MTPPPSIRRRWYRFSLRSILVFVALAAICLAWIGKERRQSAYETQQASQLLDQGFLEATLGGPYDSWKLRRAGNPQGWWRDLATQVLGERIVVLNVDQHFPGETSLRHVGISGLEPLSELRSVRFINLHPSEVTDLTPLSEITTLECIGLNYSEATDLAPLANLKELREIELVHSAVTDIAPLAELPNLERVYLPYTQVNDLTPLHGLKKLTFLDLRGTLASEQQIRALKKALPNCEIMLEEPTGVPMSIVPNFNNGTE